MWSVIKKPLVTEKNSVHQAANVYAFEVEPNADKTEIRNAVQKAFGVKVVGVRTQNVRGRQKRVGQRMSEVKYTKKALVKLAEGDKIALFEGA